MKVLIAEDDPIIVEGLKIALSQEGYEVDAFGNMDSAIKAVKEEVHYDVCLLDITLPDGDGYQICKAIREKSDVPIIFLTACDDELHTVLAFENEADDYISKPFRIRELLARIKAVMRRSGGITSYADKAEKKQEEDQKPIEIGRNILDIRSGRIMRDDEEIFLSAAEYRLLLTFVRNRGLLLTRQQILNSMWDSAGDFVNDNTLSVYVKRLRKKLEQEGDEPIIQTVRGMGYRMV
ncbi:response regulator transcription factor [Ruminococcus sp.]|uniref:response regulator transcription factor n=1 Tax=Ruminococcus sp. TaxID=41978 RepID=UPI0025F1176F|nr:response regulator transcription factor [Ruminococcus sp.]